MARYVRNVVIGALALVALMWLVKGCAGQELSSGQGIFCDTQAEAERLAELSPQGFMKAAQQVNEENKDPTACFPTAAQFIIDKVVKTVQIDGKSYDLIEVTVLMAYNQMTQQVVPVAPAKQYAFTPSKGFGI